MIAATAGRVSEKSIVAQTERAFAKEYDLRDVEAGAYLGRFASEEEALRVVRDYLESYGDAYVEGLELGLSDNGRPLGSNVTGNDLLRRAYGALHGGRSD